MASSINSCVLITDTEGIVRYATFTACRLFGLSDYEATNEHFAKVAKQISAKLPWLPIASALEAGEVVEETTGFTSPVGYRGLMHLHGHPVVSVDEVVRSYVFVLEVLPEEHTAAPKTRQFDFAGKYSTTSLTYERGRELFLRMDQLVRDEELFRKTKLSVSSLAQQLNTNTQYLSHVINYFCGERFPSYVNRLRIQWMANHLGDAGGRRSSGQWREAGFGSYSAYHRALKQLKSLAEADGQTPVKQRLSAEVTQ